MRKGTNPQKKRVNLKNFYTHQVVIPVYIPNQEGFFKDSFKILKLCLQSLLKATHSKTFITIVNNGSEQKVVAYLNQLFEEKQIHELIHTTNIGKINAVIKGVKGHDFELITIADADVLFLNNWQKETVKTFNAFEKAGVVGIVPQFKMFLNLSTNVLFDKFWSKNLAFTNVENPEAMKLFYKSIDWDDNYNKDYLKTHLTLVSKSKLKVIVGSGHFIATYKSDALKNMPSETCEMKMGKALRKYFDEPVLRVGGWRLTTPNNYAYHMGNVYESWMTSKLDELKDETKRDIIESNKITLKSSWISYYVKNHLFRKLLENKRIMKVFIKFKGLPKSMVKDY